MTHILHKNRAYDKNAMSNEENTGSLGKSKFTKSYPKTIQFTMKNPSRLSQDYSEILLTEIAQISNSKKYSSRPHT